MEIETSYGVDTWYSGTWVEVDGVYMKYKKANEQFLYRIYWIEKGWDKSESGRNPRETELTECGHVYFKTKREAECAIAEIGRAYPNHECRISYFEGRDRPFVVLLERTIKKYDWRNKTMTSIGRTFEEEDEPTYVNKRMILKAKLNEVTEKLELAFEVEDDGQ